MRATAYCDGRGNCFDGSCATFMVLETGEVIERSVMLGDVTNNVAEYEGLILTLVVAIENHVTDLIVRSDSQLIVHQVKGLWKIKEKSLIPLRDRAWSKAESFSSVKIEWIPREKNKRADQLCRDISKSHREPVAERIRKRAG